MTLNCSTPTVLGREYGESVNLSQTGTNDSYILKARKDYSVRLFQKEAEKQKWIRKIQNNGEKYEDMESEGN